MGRCRTGTWWCRHGAGRQSRRSRGTHQGIRRPGIESFIFSGYPHLEEAYRFAELVFPLLPEPYASLAGRGITNLTGPFGEMIANDLPPQAK